MQLATEGVALGQQIEHPEVGPVEHDHPGAGAEHRRPGTRELAQRISEPFALDAERHHRRFAAGHHEGVEALQISRDPDLARARAKSLQYLLVRVEAALEGEDAYQRCR